MSSRGGALQQVAVGGHDARDRLQDGPHPEHADYSSFGDFSDPDGNTWMLQEKAYRSEG